MSEQKPSVGRIVHYVSYVSYGTPPGPDGVQAGNEQPRAIGGTWHWPERV